MSLNKSATREIVEEYIKDNVRNDDTESIQSLQEDKLDLNKKAIPGFNTYVPEGSSFPEEYDIETRTGLVKVSTLQKLNRVETVPSTHSTKKQQELDPERLKKRIERNQKEIDKQKNPNKFQKFIKSLFG